MHIATRLRFTRLAKGALAAVAATMMALGSGPARAADAWPNGTITFIVPFLVGGGGDTLARMYGNQVGRHLGATMVTENRPGAGGNIGTALVARAKPDGNTLLFGTNGIMGTNLVLYKNPGFKLEDFEPVTIFGQTPLVFVVGKDSPFKDVAGLVAYAKQHPGELTCGSAGNGTASHIACEMLQQKAGIEVRHIPFQGGAAALIDLRAERISFMIDVMTYLVPQVKAGAVRALGVSMTQPVAALPGVPPVSQSVPGFETYVWDGLFAPKGTPADRLDKLHAAMAKAADDPAFVKQMGDNGDIVPHMSRAEFAAFVKKEAERTGGIVKKLGAQIN